MLSKSKIFLLLKILHQIWSWQFSSIKTCLQSTRSLHWPILLLFRAVFILWIWMVLIRVAICRGDFSWRNLLSSWHKLNWRCFFFGDRTSFLLSSKLMTFWSCLQLPFNLIFAVSTSPCNCRTWSLVKISMEIFSEMKFS